MTQRSSVAASGASAGRSREHRRVRSGTLVDHGEPRLDRGAVPGIDRAVDRSREDDGAALLEALEVLAPGRAVRREARLRDGDKAPALGEPRQRGRHMPQRRVRPAPVDIGERRERRVHQNDGGADAGTEVVVDLGRVEARDAGSGKRWPRARRALGEFVEDERGAGKLGEDREQARAGRRLQHAVGRCDRGRSGRHERQRERRGELLEGLALLRASRMTSGSRSATLASIASRAMGAPARAPIAPPNLRRNRTAAASQAS